MSEDKDAKAKKQAQLDEEPPEPWERWETKLVLISIGIGLVCLVVGGWAINHYIL